MPARNHKRKSDQPVASEYTPIMAAEASESPSKKRKTGITALQKQALIDNLQLEVTERARKLRAQYNLQAQGLRTRIEIRVNRIPMALRKLKMGDLLLKHSSGLKALTARQTVTSAAGRAPPASPEKTHTVRSVALVPSSPPPRAAHARPQKRSSDDISGGDKENQVAHDGTKKRQRLQNQPGGLQASVSGMPPHAPLSPASSNTRINARVPVAPSSPAKFPARPPSPEKQAAATNLLSTMVEKARSTRAAASRKPAAAAASTSSTGSRAKKGMVASQTARRASGTSETSDGSTSTVVRKAGRGRPAAAATAAAATKKAAAPVASTSTRKTVMDSIKKGVANAATKRAAGKTAASTSTRSGRILRKRD